MTRTLDELVPPRPAPDRWDTIVDAAGRPSRGQRRWLVRALPVAGVAVAAVLLALAWPFGGGPRGTVLERAAAAIGNGPVLHVVIRSGWGGTLIDLQTGARTQTHGEQEIWYDPERGIHEVSRFAGVLQFDAIYPPGRVSYLEKTLGGLATGYRDALREGAARVLGSDVVDGKPVYWIRVDSEMLPDVADNKLHEWAHDVAVSHDTFEPVATRETRDGKPGPDGNSIVLTVETLPKGEGNFTRMSRYPYELAMRIGQTGSLTPAEASAVLGRTAVWAGRRVAGLDLARIWKDERTEGYERRSRTWEKTYTGVTFFYGTVDEKGDPIFGVRKPDGTFAPAPFVQMSESQTLDRGFQRGVMHYSPPEGSILVFGGRIAVMQKDGVHLALEGSSEDVLLAAARALEPVPAS